MTHTPTTPPIDWQALETEFVNGFTSYEDLAAVHSINPATLRKRGERGGWTAKRHELAQTVMQAAQQRLSVNRVDELSALHNQALAIAKTVNNRITAALDSGDLSATDLRTLASAAKTALDLGKVATMPSPAPCRQAAFNEFDFDLDLSFMRTIDTAPPYLNG